MEFSEALCPGVAAGEITVSYRLWKSARVKVANRYRSARAEVEIEVDSLELVPFAAIPEDDVRLSGEKDREALRQRAAHSGPIHDDTLLWRVGFHVVDS